MPALSRISLRSNRSLEHFQLSSRRRAALRTTLRKSETPAANAGPYGHGLFPVSFQLWMPLLLVPLIVTFLAILSASRALGSAIRWILIWTSGFFAGGILAWCGNAVFQTGYSLAAIWAAGGFLGLVLLSSFYGMCLEWVFWLSRHENNPYAGTVSLSAEQEADRVSFAKKLHWPTALASAAGGFVFALVLFPLIANNQTAWPGVWIWSVLGGVSLALQGLLLGVFLGFWRRRVVFDASKHSLGEYAGWKLAGKKTGFRAALAWGFGYALHQLPAGLIAGLVLGLATNLLI